MEGLAQALQDSGLGTWARESSYAYPAANVAHLLGLVLLVGGIGIVDLRLAGLWRRIQPEPLSWALTPFAVAGLLLMVPSGFLMFAADAAPLVRSPVFRLKLLLIALALANAVVFRIVWRDHLTRWDSMAPPLARMMAAGSVLMWLIVGALGRLIAYT